MRAPARNAQVHLHVPGARGGVAKSKHRVAKVRAAFRVGEAGMKHAHGLAVQGSQPVALEALMQPNRLQKGFGRVVRVVAQAAGDRKQAFAPFGVAVGGRMGHAKLLLCPPRLKVKFARGEACPWERGARHCGTRGGAERERQRVGTVQTAGAPAGRGDDGREPVKLWSEGRLGVREPTSCKAAPRRRQSRLRNRWEVCAATLLARIANSRCGGRPPCATNTAKRP